MDDAAVTIPEDLTALEDSELADLSAALEAEFDRLHDEGSRDLTRLAELADGIDACRTEATVREEAAAADDAAIEALLNRVHPSAETPTDPAPDDDEPADEPAPAEDGAKEPVLASAGRTARKPSPAAIASKAPRTPAVPKRPDVSIVITAAADVPDLPSGSKIDMLAVAKGFHDKARQLNDHGKAPVARIHLTLPNTLGKDPEVNVGIVNAAVGQSSHNAMALVASGGWCAPSQPIYDLFEIGDADGLIDLPTMGAPRGGVLVPSYFGFGDTAGALWTWTEAMDIDAADNDGSAGDVTKPCLKIPCPTWQDYRMEAEGLCVTHGNLSDRAFPELTRSFLNTVMNAHLHRMSASKIAKIASGATAVAFAGERSDAAGDLLSAIGLQAADLRSQYRAARTRSVDVILPDWTVEALRANLAMRAGVDLLSVTDQQIIGYMTARGVRVQFVSDYQPLYGAAPRTDWPTTVSFLMFFSGAYAALDGGEIDLGVQRDSILNATNDFTAAWSEQFFQVARLGPVARQVAVDLGIDGVTACCAAP